MIRDPQLWHGLSNLCAWGFGFRVCIGFGGPAAHLAERKTDKWAPYDSGCSNVRIQGPNNCVLRFGKWSTTTVGVFRGKYVMLEGFDPWDGIWGCPQSCLRGNRFSLRSNF